MLAPSKHALVLTIHRCADGESARTLSGACESWVAGSTKTTVGESPLQYADFAEWQLQQAQSNDEQGREGREFWARAELSSVAAATLPFQEKGDPASAVESGCVARVIDNEVCSRMESLAVANGVPLSAVLLACWQGVLARLTGRTIHNRGGP